MVEAVPDKTVIGKQFRKDAKPLMEHLSNLSRTDVEGLEGLLQDKG